MVKQLAQRFDKTELIRLVDDKNSCVKIHKSVYNLQLYPYHLTDISTSIKELLNAKIAKYDQKLDGILLGYANLKLLTPQGAIICDSCFIHIDIEGEFYLFKPEVDSLLTGIVNKKSDDHVGCLVHQLFNISVPSTDDWIGKEVNVGDEIVVKIVYMDLDSRLPYFKAELIKIKTRTKKKVIQEEVEDQTEDSSSKRKRKRNKRNLEDSILENSYTDDADTPVKKKNKRIKLDETNTTDLNESGSKKKKKVKVELDETTNNDTSLNESISKKNKKVKKEIKTEDNETQDEIVENGLHESINNLNNNESISTKRKKHKEIVDEKVNESHEELLTKKQKKSKLKDETEVTTGKKNKRKSKEKTVEENLNGYSEEILMRPTEMIKQVIEEPTQKNRKSDECKRKDSLTLHTTPTVMADLEDRKHKKLNSSKNVLWDNKELDLYDPELEQTLKEKAEESEFNLVKISALNEGSEMENKSEEKKKKKRKNSEGEKEIIKKEELNFEDESNKTEIKKKSKKKSKRA